eukprot:6225796-Prymnesium_polylepis.1
MNGVDMHGAAMAAVLGASDAPAEAPRRADGDYDGAAGLTSSASVLDARPTDIDAVQNKRPAEGEGAAGRSRMGCAPRTRPRRARPSPTRRAVGREWRRALAPSHALSLAARRRQGNRPAGAVSEVLAMHRLP